MKITLIILSLMLSAANLVLAQRTCGAMEVYHNQIIKDSLFRSNRRIINTLYERYKLNHSNKKLQALDITIPVVVHVVYNKSEQKISLEQVASQIKSMNEDYAAINVDIKNVPPSFKSIVAKEQGISFKLALRDPNGNPTTRVEYIQTTSDGFDTNENVKFKKLGGADAWPATQYLNLWVCNLQGGLLGYAQFPGGAAATDGVVINYIAFGSQGSAKAPYDKGRTVTHEVGHWLDLFHIWGDDNTACTGSDEMNDTPNQAGPNFGCPTYPHVSCNNGPNGDLFMNYMDYVDDACMVMFSTDQAIRIRSTLQNVRTGFGSSPGLIDPQLKLQSTKDESLKLY